MTRKGPDMADNWKPGDVAIVKNEFGIWNRAILQVHPTGRRWVYGVAHDSTPATGAEAQLVVVIDPADREQVERLLRGYHVESDLPAIDRMQVALRGFANPTPPKPDEPTGHLAVVIDTDGNRWINWRDLRDDMDHERPWVLASDGFTYRDYADIDVAEIKWEGIQ